MSRRSCRTRTVIVPLLLPRLSGRAAAQLLDILGQLHGCVQHHYGEQAWRWQRQQRQLEQSCRQPQLRLDDEDEPF